MSVEWEGLGGPGKDHNGKSTKSNLDWKVAKIRSYKRIEGKTRLASVLVTKKIKHTCYG